MDTGTAEIVNARIADLPFNQLRLVEFVTAKGAFFDRKLLWRARRPKNDAQAVEDDENEEENEGSCEIGKHG